MNKDLAGYRKTYDKNTLEEQNLPGSPFQLFSEWFEEVEKRGGVEEVNAMTLTTLGLDGFPKSRVVLLKHFDTKGFVFYTNYNSQKGEALEADNNVCISFFWPNLERQVIIKGKADRISEEQSKLYFNSRPRGSQLGAWASDQSSIIASREILEEKLELLEQEYRDKAIPKPDFWGGFLVEPIEFEFWQGRPNRLHDRIRYIHDHKKWRFDRLAP